METKVIIFLIFFTLPMIYWRTIFYFYVEKLDKPVTRTKTGLQVHHGHFGFVFVVISSIYLIFFDNQNLFLIALFSLGIGLIADEFIPLLLMPGDRKVELEVYQKSFKPTLILFSIVISLGIIYLLFS